MLVGVNATADATKRLSVTSRAALFNAETDDLRLTLNKVAAGDSASALFQTGWSGRAEFGTTGDDDFHVEASPDGAAWTEALVIDKGDGTLSLVSGSIGTPDKAW